MALFPPDGKWKFSFVKGGSSLGFAHKRRIQIEYVRFKHVSMLSKEDFFHLFFSHTRRKSREPSGTKMTWIKAAGKSTEKFGTSILD